MRKGIKRMAMTGMALFVIASMTACDFGGKEKEVDYGLKGNPVSDNKDAFLLGDTFYIADYKTANVYYYGDNSVVAAYNNSDNSKTKISIYDYVQGTMKEAEVEGKYSIEAVADNGNVLIVDNSNNSYKYYVVDGALQTVFTSESVNNPANIVMSEDGKYVCYGNNAEIIRYDIQTQTPETIFTSEKQGAQVVVSKVAKDASSVVAIENVFEPSFSTATYAVNATDKAKTELALEGNTIGVSDGIYTMANISDEASSDKKLKLYDYEGLISGTAKSTVPFENFSELAAYGVDEANNMIVTATVNGSDSDYTSGLHLRYYDLNSKRLVSSLIIPAEDLFEQIKAEAAGYDGDNHVSWIQYVTVESIGFNANNSQVVIGINDNNGAHAVVWNCELKKAEETTTQENLSGDNAADKTEQSSTSGATE